MASSAFCCVLVYSANELRVFVGQESVHVHDQSWFSMLGTLMATACGGFRLRFVEEKLLKLSGTHVNFYCVCMHHSGFILH